jgi:hypothetical protein
MGLWGRIKKTAKRAGKQVKRTTKVVGSQVKRSTIAVAPILLGPGLGEKVGIMAAGNGKGSKSALKAMGRVSNVTGRVVQIGATALGTIFGGPIVGAAAYRGTALLRQLNQHQVQEAKYKAGMTTTRGHNVVWKKQPVRILEGLAAGVGGAAVGSLAGGTSFFASGSSMFSGITGIGAAAPATTGVTGAMEASTASMIAGETGVTSSAAAAGAAGGTGVLGYATAGTGVLGIASQLLGAKGNAGAGGMISELIGDQSGVTPYDSGFAQGLTETPYQEGMTTGGTDYMTYIIIAAVVVAAWYFLKKK